MISIPHPMKSRTLRVATAAPLDLAMAAIWQSKVPIGVPVARRLAPISAYSRAALLSNAKTRLAKYL